MFNLKLSNVVFPVKVWAELPLKITHLPLFVSEPLFVKFPPICKSPPPALDKIRPDNEGIVTFPVARLNRVLAPKLRKVLIPFPMVTFEGTPCPVAALVVHSVLAP